MHGCHGSSDAIGLSLKLTGTQVLTLFLAHGPETNEICKRKASF